MGFLDKVKEQAAVATAAAKDATQKGQAKLEEMKEKKSADALLRDLGAAAYAQHAGRGTATSDADIERLITSLQQFEAEHGQIDLSLTSGTASSTAPPPPPPAGAPATPPPPPTGQTL